MTAILNVNLYGEKIGSITLLPNERSLFVFDKSYINDPDRPTLSQSFYNQSGGLITDSRPVHTKLPAFFSNLLPEGYLRLYLATLGGINVSREFQLLRLLGEDLPGAITVHTDTTINSVDHSDTTTHHSTITTTPKDSLRFSLAGVQLKFSAIARSKKGLTIPTNGMGGDWIVKLPSPQFHAVPENEWAMLKLASEIDIPVPETQLVPIQDIMDLPDIPIAQSSEYAMAIKRFDRGSNGTRLHIEDFAQVYGLLPEKKYQKVSYGNIAKMVWDLTGEKGLTDYIRRLTFSILIGNGDMHLKNWSLIYPDKQTPQLAPAYDFVSTIPYLANDQLALTLMKSRDMSAISMDHFIKMAQQFQLPKYLVKKAVYETAESTRDVWQTEKKGFDLPKNILIKIDQHIQGLSI